MSTELKGRSSIKLHRDLDVRHVRRANDHDPFLTLSLRPGRPSGVRSSMSRPSPSGDRLEVFPRPDRRPLACGSGWPADGRSVEVLRIRGLGVASSSRRRDRYDSPGRSQHSRGKAAVGVPSRVMVGGRVEV